MQFVSNTWQLDTQKDENNSLSLFFSVRLVTKPNILRPLLNRFDMSVSDNMKQLNKIFLLNHLY